MSKVKFAVSVSLLVALLLTACAPSAAPSSQPAPQQPAAPAVPAAPAAPKAPAAAAVPAWQTQWDNTLAAARREGTVVFANDLGSLGRAAVVQAFQQAYGISVESISGRSDQNSERILRERRAGLYNYDVYMLSASSVLASLKPAGALDPLEPSLITPDLTDPELIKKTWWPGKLWWVDAEHTHLAPMLSITMPLAINTSMVKDGDIKSYKDLLDPKWQGKIVINDPTVPGTGPAWLLFADGVLGWNYVEAVAKAKPVLVRDNRLSADWLAHGKAAILIAPQPSQLTEFMAAGAPIKGLIPAEGTWVIGGSNNLSAINRPPHPNAAKIFINWYLSKEGQTVVGPVAGKQSNRTDVSTSHLPPEQVRQPGVNYYIEDDEKLQLSRPALMKKAEPLYLPLLTK